jgi:hypothetical protein
MGWKDWFGIAPRRGEFAQDLARHAAKRGVPGWVYDDAESVLVHAERKQKFFVQNAWREYSAAPRAARSTLIEKYLSMMLDDAPEVPQLWELAAKGVYGCLRSRYQLVTTEIESRGETPPFVRPVSMSWLGDLDLVLMYDFGAYLAQVRPDTAEVWGQSHEAIFARAKANLTALERPRWEALGDAVFKIVSDVSFEESFALVDAVVAALQVQGDVVVAIPNRGVLLATGTLTPGGLKLLIAEARRSLQEAPWPMSGMLFRRAAEQWHVFQPDPELAGAARTFELVSLAGTYLEQQEALQKHLEKNGVDVYVAKFDLMGPRGDAQAPHSWCVWSEGVPSLLPLTDVVILRPSDEDAKPVIAPWDAVQRLCGHHMQRTADEPPRFDVKSFPTAEWAEIVRVGEAL